MLYGPTIRMGLLIVVVEKLGKFEIGTTVNDRTTHLICLAPLRTVNILRAIARGLWILRYNWILDSQNSGEWLLEDLYEMREFSKAVTICRGQRQAFGIKYHIDIFRNIGPFYVSAKCACPSLKELILLCSGRTTDRRNKAKYVITEQAKEDGNSICVQPNWILDSIQEAKLKNVRKYILKRSKQVQLTSNCNI